MLDCQTTYEVICNQANYAPDEIAILAPFRPALTYQKLKHQIDQTIQSLQSIGIGQQDRIALVLPNSSEFAVALLAVCSCAIAAPLNTTLSEAEFQHYFKHLNITTVMLQADVPSPAREAATAIGLTIIELRSEINSPAGKFELLSKGRAVVLEQNPPNPEDIALLLQTSGTTSTPKIVPLTHANLWAGATNVGDALQLQPGDRNLLISPLFYIQGIVCGLLASIYTRGSIVCCPGFDAKHFFDWFTTFQPTWFAAVPTVLQTILTEAAGKAEIIHPSPLRLIRAAATPLPPNLHAELEQTFKVPVLEAYGMTEAYQISCNPLPPGSRKVGSVGIPTHTKIAIIDADGHFLEQGKVGEIVLQGPNVFHGYENSAITESATFINGWFRTGDQGYLDPDGYLFITGRLKELINRGGEKIAPREVDEALLAHPQVAQAIAFGVRHPRYGEAVAAAVVLQADKTATEQELQSFVATQIAGFKVPQRIIFLEELPKGATGKVKRIELAQVLESKLKAEFILPTTTLEKRLLSLWQEILGVTQISIHDNFFALGGDSLQAITLLSQVEQICQKPLPPATIFQALTIAHLAEIIAQNTPNQLHDAGTSHFLVPIQSTGQKPPLFAVHDISGWVSCYRHLARYLEPDQPFYGLQAQGLADKRAPLNSVAAIARLYLQEIRTVQPEGPYFLMGYSFGGLIAFEMAQQLQQQQEIVALLALIDSFAAGDRQPFRLHQKIARHLRYTLMFGPDYLTKRFSSQFNQMIYGKENTTIDLPVNPEVVQAHRFAIDTYMPAVYPGEINFFEPTDRLIYQEWCIADPFQCWNKRTSQGLKIHHVPGAHGILLADPHVKVLAEKLNACLHETQKRSNNA